MYIITNLEIGRNWKQSNFILYFAFILVSVWCQIGFKPTLLADNNKNTFFTLGKNLWWIGDAFLHILGQFFIKPIERMLQQIDKFQISSNCAQIASKFVKRGYIIESFTCC